MTTKIPVELSSTPGIVDNSNATAITIDSSEDVTLAGHIALTDSKNIKLGAGTDLQLYHDGTNSYITNSTGNITIDAQGSDTDIIFKGTDSSSDITALTLDMSEEGRANFNSHVILETSGKYLQVTGSSSNAWALGSTGGENAPGTASTSFAFHRWNGSAWNNAVEIDTNGIITPDTGTGGIKLGGAAAANLLDHYEEGTWTPVLDNCTVNSSTMYGIYTRIGRICFIHAHISVTVASLPGAQFQISGLPFAATNTSDTGQRAIIAIGGDALNTGAAVNGRAHFITNGSTLQGINMNSGTKATFTYNIMDSSTFKLHIHGYYTI